MSRPPPSPEQVAAVVRRTVGASAKRRVHVHETLLPALWEAHPQVEAGDASLMLLAGVLTAMAAAGEVALPVGAHLYDATHASRLPAWIAGPPAAAPPPEVRRGLFHPRLSGAGKLTRERDRARAASLDAFLRADVSGLDPRASLQERALMVFGDDKALRDADGGVVLPIPVPVTTEDLRCRRLGAHMHAEGLPGRATETRDLLVVENQATYESTCLWNDAEAVFPAVGWGEGYKVLAMSASTLRVMERHGCTGITYFGDLDWHGVRIATSLARDMAARGVRVVPYRAAYAWLAANGIPVTTSKVRDESVSLSASKAEVDAWIDDAAVSRRLSEVVSDGARVPQEWLGIDVLAKGRDFSGVPLPHDPRPRGAR